MFACVTNIGVIDDIIAIEAPQGVDVALFPVEEVDIFGEHESSLFGYSDLGGSSPGFRGSQLESGSVTSRKHGNNSIFGIRNIEM